MISVALICTANRCRSVMAHAILASEVEKRRLPIEVYSAGVFDFRGASAIEDTTRTCELYDTPAPADVATWVRDLPLESITRFLVMEKLHAQVLTEGYGIEPERVSLLGEFDPHRRGVEIADPFGQSSVVMNGLISRFATASLDILIQPPTCQGLKGECLFHPSHPRNCLLIR